LGFVLAFLIGFFSAFVFHGSEVGSIVILGFSLLIGYVTTVIGGAFYRKSFLSLAQATGNDIFKWAGNLLFWGSLTVIVIVGGLLMWIGWVLLTVAFFTTDKGEEVNPNQEKP